MISDTLHNVQTSNDKNYSQTPTNLDESWSVGISITCSSCQTCSEACRSDPGSVQTSNHKNYSQNPTNFDDNARFLIVIANSSCHKCSQACRSDHKKWPGTLREGKLGGSGGTKSPRRPEALARGVRGAGRPPGKKNLGDI